jgi:hypothetical protein
MTGRQGNGFQRISADQKTLRCKNVRESYADIRQDSNV